MAVDHVKILTYHDMVAWIFSGIRRKWKKNLGRLIQNKVLCLQIYKGDNITLKLVLGSVSLDSTLK